MAIVYRPKGERPVPTQVGRRWIRGIVPKAAIGQESSVASYRTCDIGELDPRTVMPVWIAVRSAPKLATSVVRCSNSRSRPIIVDDGATIMVKCSWRSVIADL